MKIKGAVVFWGLIAIIVVGIIAVVAIRMSGAKGGFGDGPKAVNVMTVTPETINTTYQTQGTIQAGRRIGMNPEMAGLVTQVMVREGQRVSAGTPLIHLKAQRQAAGLAQTRAGVAVSSQVIEAQKALVQQSRANVDAAQAQATLAKQEFSDYEALHQQDVISRLELDQKRTTLTTTKAQLTQAQQQLTQAQAQLAQSKASQQQAQAMVAEQQAAYGETVLRAPFNGIVGEIMVDPGDYVLPSERILSLVDPSSTLEISMVIPEQDRHLFHTGQAIALSASVPNTFQPRSANTSQTLGVGQITFIDPIVDPESRTLVIKGRITPTGHMPLMDGQFVAASITTGQIDKALMVPESAVVPQGEKHYVYIAEPSSDKASEKSLPKAVLTEVTLGERVGRRVALTSGVQAGQQVVVDGIIKLTDGASLMINPPASNKTADAIEPAPSSAPEKKAN